MGFFENIFGNGGPGTTTREVMGDTDIEVRTPPQVPIPLRRRSFESPIPISPQEEVLDSRETSSDKPIGMGITEARFLEIVDDGKAVFKTVDFPEERAAYLVDLFLGFGLVPTTVIRELKGEIGSAQEFIPDAKMGLDCSVSELSEENYIDELMKLWVFDCIIANRDRHNGNFLVKDGKIYAIDHGRSFGWTDSKDLHGRTSAFGKQIDTSQYYWGYKLSMQFLSRPIPQDVVSKLKEFMMKPSEQKILENLLAELIGTKHAALAIKRIKVIGAEVIEKGTLPVNQYMKIDI